jgi:hypothetical protein
LTLSLPITGLRGRFAGKGYAVEPIGFTPFLPGSHRLQAGEESSF